MSVVVVIPTRGRPETARDAVAAIRETAVRVATSVVLAVDADDPALPAYRALRWPGRLGPSTTLVVLESDETGDLVRATNTVSLRVAREDPSAIIGNLGDDHRTRTPGWDRAIEEALEEPGIAYGDDLLQGELLPTAPFISASIVLALGWYALPACRHLYIDDAWKAIGEEAGLLRYLPDVVVEHCHPGAGKAEWDAGYERANAADATEADRLAYLRWRNGPLFAADLENVRRRKP